MLCQVLLCQVLVRQVPSARPSRARLARPGGREPPGRPARLGLPGRQAPQIRLVCPAPGRPVRDRCPLARGPAR